MTLRCPYCHDAVEVEAGTACVRCGALRHPACVLELGRCASCGAPGLLREAPAPAGWEAVRADDAVQGWVQRLPRVLPPPAAGPGGDGTGDLSLRLEVARRVARVGDLLAGTVVLRIPRPQRLGSPNLELCLERARAGWLGLWRQRVLLRRLPLWGASEVRARGLYAPGTYRARFRLSLAEVPPTADAAGARQTRRVVLSARLPRRGGPLEASLELRVDSDHGVS
ncbi:MAG: hypothetical protein D6731_04325 [Planctomycetota bacterium]|nr:MAG: hypothetical protein D6731_04325 [Planctomycetota bacterium]